MVPLKPASPLISGVFGWLNGPAAAISARARISPAGVVMRQRCSAASQAASSAAVPKRTWGVTPSLSATSRR
jgi:hypothetical protein